MNKPLKVVFMGTPEFAVTVLGKIHHGPHEVVCVVTVPDKPAGRGKKLRGSAVKEYSLQHNLTLMQPVKMKDPVFIEELQRYNADVFVVVAFRMLPKIVWSLPPKGTFNLHASLLPQYRGAAPINHAIVNGEKQSGVTTFFIDNKIDTGKIIMQKKVAISEKDNAGDLHDKLMVVGADLVAETLEKISQDKVEEIPQEKLILNGTILKSAPKIFKKDLKIDWSKPVKDVYNLIRGMSPYPAAFTKIKTEDGKIMNLKIFSTHIFGDNITSQECGKILTDGEHYLRITCGVGTLEIDSLQLEGKRRMSVHEFLNGFRKIKNTVLISE